TSRITSPSTARTKLRICTRWTATSPLRHKRAPKRRPPARKIKTPRTRAARAKKTSRSEPWGSSADLFCATRHERPGRERHDCAGHCCGNRRLDHAPAGERIARATGKAAREVQRDAVVLSGNQVKHAAVGCDQRGQNLADDSQNILSRGRHRNRQATTALDQTARLTLFEAPRHSLAW